jgi:acyl-CoA synthetase (AMP-forming)/AMP-acid ligase II
VSDVTGRLAGKTAIVTGASTLSESQPHNNAEERLVPLSMLLEMSADAWPDRVALGTSDDRMTYGQLRAAATSGARALLATGARSVAYLGLNGPDFAVALWSAALAGLPFCPLSYRMSAAQLHPLLGKLDAPVVLTTPAYEKLVNGTRARRLSPGALTAVRRHHEEDDTLPAVTDDAAAVLLFTSGTTATPKAVVLTHENLVSYVIETVEFGSAAADDAILVTMPPYHVAGVNAALTNPFAGRRIVYLPDFDAVSWLATARAQAVTHAMVVPTMLARIVDELGGEPASLPALRVLSYGGARMPRAVLERALEAFPDAGFVNAYGLTETSSTIAVLSPEDHRAARRSADPAVRARLSSVGRLVPGRGRGPRCGGRPASARGSGRGLAARPADFRHVPGPGVRSGRRRLVSHARPGLYRRRRISLHRRPRRRHHHSRRREHCPRRDRRGAHRA